MTGPGSDLFFGLDSQGPQLRSEALGALMLLFDPLP
jgi:hypothetical protein